MASRKISELPPATTPLTGAEVVAAVQGGVNVKLIAAQMGGLGVLNTNTTFHVDIAAGSDTTGDGTSGKPWQTLQYAVDKVPSLYAIDDQEDFTTVTISCANTGTYAPAMLGSFVGNGYIYVNGNGATIDGSLGWDGTCINCTGGYWFVDNWITINSDPGSIVIGAINVAKLGILSVGTVTMGATVSGSHFGCTLGGQLYLQGPITVTGAASAFAAAKDLGSRIYAQHMRATFSVDPHYNPTLFSSRNAYVYWGPDSFSGVNTGPKYFADQDGVIGADGTVPGTSTGTANDSAYVTGNGGMVLATGFVGDSGSGGLPGYVPASAAGSSSAGKFLKADGTWQVPGGVVYTVSTLPAGALGARATVSDAVAPTFLGALTGGGTVKCPVFHNGAAWVAG